MSKWQFARYQAKKIESSVLTDKVWLFQSVYDTIASAARARGGANQSFEQWWWQMSAKIRWEVQCSPLSDPFVSHFSVSAEAASKEMWLLCAKVARFWVSYMLLRRALYQPSAHHSHHHHHRRCRFTVRWNYRSSVVKCSWLCAHSPIFGEFLISFNLSHAYCC